MSTLNVKIFVAGLGKRNSDTIVACKEAFSANVDSNAYQIEIVDIFKKTSLTESKKILATPTIICENAFGEKRIIGELKDPEKAKQAIEFLTADLLNQEKDGKNKRASKTK